MRRANIRAEQCLIFLPIVVGFDHLGLSRYPRDKRTVFNHARSRSYRYAQTDDLHRAFTDILSQSYGLAERLLREGNQMHMAVSDTFSLAPGH